MNKLIIGLLIYIMLMVTVLATANLLPAEAYTREAPIRMKTDLHIMPTISSEANIQPACCIKENI